MIGSFNFDESQLLGEIYAQALEGAGIRVERAFDLGPRELVWPALHEGLVDVVPEYLGTAVTATDPDARLEGSSPADLWQRLRSALSSWRLIPLTPSPAQDQNAVAVLAATARARRWRSVSDVARASAPTVLGGPTECPQRPLCLPGLERVYGLRVGGFEAFDDAAQRFQALSDGVIDAEITFTTDPHAASGEIVLLRDDRHLQPDEAVTPVVSQRAVRRDGARLVATLDAVSARLTTSALRFLNWRVSVAHKAVQAEARAWLRRHGLRAG